MTIDIYRFAQACDPSRTLAVSNPEDLKYYIDFSPVRGSNVIQELRRTITLSPTKPTCQLFTGHVGCGKSTELLRLKAEMEAQGFYVVYFVASDDLDTTDVDVTDILIAIARRVSESLEKDKIRPKPGYLAEMLADLGEILQTPMELSQVEFSVGISKITTKAKPSPELRNLLRQYTEPRTSNILQSINEDLLQQAEQDLKQRGKKGLVVLIDNLDRVDQRELPTGRSQHEYLFIDRGDQLSRLNCHVVYTFPLALAFSNEVATLTMRFGRGLSPKLLPMVPVYQRDGSVFEPGLAMLRQMVLARAFPDTPADQRLSLTNHVFKGWENAPGNGTPAEQAAETLDRLCKVSGGHLRNLLGLLNGCLRQSDPPFSRDTMETVIRRQRDALARTIDDWECIFQVLDRQTVRGDAEYQALLRSMFVFEYEDMEGNWFGINPILAETKHYKNWQATKMPPS